MSRFSSRLPIPHLFMGASIVLFMVIAMVGPAAGDVVDGTCAGEAAVEGVRVVDAQRPGSTPIEIPEHGTAQVAGSFAREPLDEAASYRGAR